MRHAQQSARGRICLQNRALRADGAVAGGYQIEERRMVRHRALEQHLPVAQRRVFRLQFVLARVHRVRQRRAVFARDHAAVPRTCGARRTSRCENSA